VKRALLPLVGLAVLSGCDRDALYSGSSFSDDVYSAYEECNPAEIRYLAGKHNLQTVFENCGANNFGSFAWAPDGVHVYFELPMTAHIMDAEKKTIEPLPTEKPIAEVAWLDVDLLALPLPPEEGKEHNRLVLYDRSQRQLFATELTLEEPDQLASGGARDHVLMLGTGTDGRTVYRVSFADGAAVKAFPWLDGAIDTFTYEPTLNRVLLGRGGTVTMHDGATGEVLSTWNDATRGSLHPEGRYLALETLGAAISPFDQRAWDESTPEARERELRRQAKWLEKQPDWVPTSVRPPTLDLVDLEQGKRYRITSFYGERFQWYTATNYYASFVLWGIEGKELNTNVALTNLAERLRMAGKGEVPLGLERYEDAQQPDR